MAKVTVAVLVAMVLPLASWTVTTGWVANTPLTAAPEGCVVKTSLAAGPGGDGEAGAGGAGERT